MTRKSLELSREVRPTFDASIEDGTFAPKFSSVPSSSTKAPFGGSVQWVGNATTIIRYGQITFMTDPNFLHQGDHVHLGPGVVGERLKDPAFPYVQCPPVDFILLSHLHADHFDQLVEEKMRKDVPIVSTPHACERLVDKGFTALHALETWQEIEVRKGDERVTITAMPAKHTVATFEKVNELLGALPPVMGSIVKFTSEGRTFSMYISGDTLYYDDLKEIHTRYPEINLALVHLGGTTLPVIRVLVTMDAEQGMKLLCALKPETVIPIHFDDYDVFESPLSDFQKLVAESDEFRDRVVYLDRGQSYEW